MKKGLEDINGFLDRGVTVKGELQFTNMLRLDGRVEGKIISDSHLVVGRGAEVEGEIDVGHATLGGSVRGTVRAKKRVEILRDARVTADLHAPTLTIEEGAFFEGRCHMSGAKKAHGAQESQPFLAAAKPVLRTASEGGSEEERSGVGGPVVGMKQASSKQ
jgi:cytoskeletal protein CcmA (bactofilin family)